MLLFYADTFQAGYLRIHLSVQLHPFSLLLSLLDLAIQIPLVGFAWFAGGQRSVILSFYVSFKRQHQPEIAHVVFFKRTNQWMQQPEIRINPYFS